MIQFPEDPHDGMELIDYVDEVTVIIWTYNQSQNQWTYKKFGSPDTYVFTDQVLVRDNMHELPQGADADPSELQTQKDVNYFLHGQQPELPEMPSLDGYATEQWVQNQNYASRSWVNNKGYATESWVGEQNYATQQQLSQLQQEVDNLSGLVVQARYSNGNGITTRPGEFVVLANDTQQTRFSAGEVIRFHETDASNKAPALVRIIIGDLIHVVNPRDGTFTVLQVTQAAGIVQSYTCLGGTMDTIPNNTALEFRISGAN